MNPEWQAAAQDTLNALAGIGGKERSSQINFGQGDAGSRGEMGDLFLAVRKLAQQKSEQIDPTLREAFRGTVEGARMANRQWQEFTVDDRIANVRNSMRELIRRDGFTRKEEAEHRSAWNEIAAEYKLSANQAGELFKGAKAEARTAAERSRNQRTEPAPTTGSASRSRGLVGEVEQRATGTDGKPAASSGRAAVPDKGVTRAEYAPGDRVEVAGAKFEVVKTNEDGTVTLKNENGDQWDEMPDNRAWRKLAAAPAPRRAPQELPRRDDFIESRQREAVETAQRSLDAIRAKISQALRDLKINLPVGISPEQYLNVHVNERGRPNKELVALNRELTRAQEAVARAQKELQNRQDAIGTTRYTHGQVHRRLVESAIAEGKPVPPEVLADYPDLKPKGATANETQPQAPDVARKPSRFSFGELPNEPKGEVLGGGFGALQKAFDKLKAAPKDAPKTPADFDVSKYVGSIANQITPKMRQDGTVRNATIQLDPQGMREMADAANRLVDAQAKGDRAAMFQAKAQMDNVLMTAKRMQRRNDPLAKVRPELTEAQRWADDKYRDGRITEQHRDNVLNAAEAVRIAAKIGDVEAIQQARRNLRDARRDMANRGVAGRVGFKTLNAASQVARSAQALTFGSEWSYIFRQGGPISLNPLNMVNTAKAFQMAYHAQGSETGKPQGKLGAFSRLFPGAKGAEWVRDQLTNHPMYKDAQRAGLETAIGSGADEIYRDSVVGKLPWLKRTETANEAALDFLRLQEFGRYKKAIDAREGQSFIERQRAYEQAAEIINTLTGRTDLGDGKVKKAVEMLNGILSAPRLNVSRIKLLDPTRIVREIRANPAVGGRMAKDAMSVTATVAGALALGNYAGFWDVSLDPDDPDFAKARDGNTRYDVSFGMLPLLRLYFKTARYGYDMAKDAAQQTPRSERERKASGDKAGSAAKTFARGRLGPLYAYANDLWWGSNLIGEPVNLRQVPTLEKNSPARRLAIPLTYAEMGEMAAEGYKRQGMIGAGKGAAKATPAMVGIGVQQYDKTKKPSARR